MIFYRVSYNSITGFSFTWHTTRADAEKSIAAFLRREKDAAETEGVDEVGSAWVSVFHIEATKKDLLRFLNTYAVAP